MGYLSRRRGVISVFLLMIFMITYVFMGMLVDAGRYHMAEAYLESALDSASNSVLSNYNDLVFDLYGLFSVDIEAEDEEAMKAAIYEKYNHYLNETLNMVDAKQYETMLAQLVKGDKTTPTMNTQSLYDFTMTTLETGTTITLADTANVESQIVEYMKFRAPVELTTTEGFLKKINAIVEMKERVEEALKKEKIKNKYETEKDGNTPLSEQAASLLRDINSFAGTLYNYTVTPHKGYEELKGLAAPSSSTVYYNNPYNAWKYIEKFDSDLNKAERDYWNKMVEENTEYINNLEDMLGVLQEEMCDAAQSEEEEYEAPDIVEVILTNSYKASAGDGYTRNFTEIQLPESLEDLKTLASDVCGKVYSGTDEWCETYCEDYENEERRHLAKVSEFLNKYKEDVMAAKTTLDTNVSNMESNAEKLYDWDKSLVTRIQDVVTRYESYAAELKSAMGENPDENKVTVYATEIELAEANMGELLKNLDLLANSRAYLDSLGYGFKDENGTRKLLSDSVVGLATAIVNNYNTPDRTRLHETPLKDMVETESRYKSASEAVDLYQQKYAVASIPYMNDDAKIVKKLFPEYQNHMCVLYSHVSYFHNGHYRQDPDVVVVEGEAEKFEINSEEGKKKAEDNGEVEDKLTTTEGKEISLDSAKVKEKPEMLKVNYSYTEQATVNEVEAEVSVEGEVTSDSITNILNTGLKLIEGLGVLLEKARDNLYVDAYVMSTFPNYKEHYKGHDAAKNASILSDGREDYLASYAEVEFIITGAGANGKTAVDEKVFEEDADGFGNMSVWSMRARLFGTRMLFNSISMLTDSAKMQQASVLSSWAGPFAPLVAAVLVICWIVAESTVDVMILMGDANMKHYAPDGELPIFKQSGDWLFSLCGVATELGGMAIDQISDKILEKAEELTASAQQKANVMIYKAYSAVDSGIDTVNGAVDSAVATGKEQMTAWGNELIQNIDGAIANDSAVTNAERLELQNLQNQLGNISGTLDGVVAEKDKLVDTAKSVTADAKEQAVLAVSKVSDKVMKTTETYVKTAGTNAKAFIGRNISKVVPIGTVVNSSKSEIKMGYNDYLYFFLFIMNQETKIKRIQAVIQANMQVGGQDKFFMESAPVAVWADLECSMKYMFLSNGIVPESMKKDGRLRLKVISAQSY